MIEPARPARRRVAGTLFAARAVYAFNWYNVGAVLPLIGATFRVGPVELGLVLGAFLVGVGIFQIPAGFASIRYGSRNVSLFALTLMGAAGVASAFSPDILVLALLRGLAGVGAAFFFSPALSLIASYYSSGERGPIIGWYNGAFSFGGAVGLFLGAAIGAAWGWPFALGLGGAALLGCAAIGKLALPSDPLVHRPRSLAALWNAGSGILRSRSIWALSLGLTGFWGATYAVAQYFVQFAYTFHPLWSYGVDAGLAALVVIVSFPGGPLGGWLAEQGRDRRGTLVMFGALAGLLVLLVPLSTLVWIAPLLVALGVTDGIVFAVLYLIPSYLPEARGEGVALGIAFINSVQVLLGSGVVVAFGLVAARGGFTLAWLFAGALAVGLLPLVSLVTPNSAPRPSPALPPSR